MSAKSTITLYCNHRDCPARIHTEFVRVDGARRHADKLGWLHQRLQRVPKGPLVPIDLCPPHANEHRLAVASTDPLTAAAAFFASRS